MKKSREKEITVIVWRIAEEIQDHLTLNQTEWDVLEDRPQAKVEDQGHHHHATEEVTQEVHVECLHMVIEVKKISLRFT